MSNWLNSLSAIKRLVICLGAAGLLLAVAWIFKIEILTGAMLAWDAFCLFMIGLSWITFFTVAQTELRGEALKQDESRPVTFIIILAIVCISLIGILVLMRTTNESLISARIHRTASFLGVALSWALLHTVFTLHYARLYYLKADTGNSKGGLDFPGEEKPDYLDFAYFSFVVGMTFQVSDVVITSKSLRKVVLLHSLLSFVFNTAIVALSISIISNLLH